MTHTSHTPGPWTYNQLGDIFGPDNKAIATTDAVPKTFNNDIANARLIAAAPDLLAYAELEAAIGQPNEEEVFRKHGYDGSMMQPHNMRDFINTVHRAAIAKARGQS